jgi:probable rRNA maturation factor
MRALNRQSLNHDRVTDVIAFRLDHDDRIVGDIYVCPAEARSSARALGISSREELIRLVVHGTLHVLGFDHPAGGQKRRTASVMWRRQERYVRRLVGTA